MIKADQDFLLEILTEELPPHDLRRLSEDLARHIESGLKEQFLSFRSIDSFATPRRLAVIVHELSSRQPDQKMERRGPPFNKAFDEKGNPTAVAIGFAQSCQVDVKRLIKQETEKGVWVAYSWVQRGESTVKLIPSLVQNAVRQLTVRKPMRWGDHDEVFARPVHSVMMLYGSRVVPAHLFGIRASRKTLGHRFLCQKKLTIQHPREYVTTLEQQGFVIPAFEKRKQNIRAQLIKVAQSHRYVPMMDEALLEQVTGLVEWPVVILGSFSKAFLSIPQEVLILSMQTHQRAFPLTDRENHLVHSFLVVSNIKSQHPEEVIQGNERVMRARLSDAAYFYEQDGLRPLEAFVEELKSIIFQAGLGTLFDKTCRLVKIVDYLASTADNTFDAASVKRAAFLAKADLMTSMVGEFPELQGVMGSYYARVQKEPESVAGAIREQYMPYNAETPLPSSRNGQWIALADRIDTLVGIFGINKKPTGDKDPFGLRRAALGIIRLLTQLPSVDLFDLISFATRQYGEILTNAHGEEEVKDFIYDRLKYWLIGQGYSANQWSAVEKNRLAHIPDFIARVKAVQAFSRLKEAEQLSMAHKRVGRLLEKEGFSVSKQKDWDRSRLKEPAEVILAEKILEKERELNHLTDYTEILKKLAELREPIDQFFDQVMVMVDDPLLQKNRFILLYRLRCLFLRVADISKL